MSLHRKLSPAELTKSGATYMHDSISVESKPPVTTFATYRWVVLSSNNDKKMTVM